MSNLEQKINQTIQTESFDNHFIRTAPDIFTSFRIKTFKPENPGAYLYPYSFAVMNYDGEIRKIQLYADSDTLMDYLKGSGIWDSKGDFDES